MNFTKTFEEYYALVHDMRVNKNKIISLSDENKDLRRRANELRMQLKKAINKEIDAGKTLTQVCNEQFGGLDRRFYILFRLMDKHPHAAVRA